MKKNYIGVLLFLLMFPTMVFAVNYNKICNQQEILDAMKIVGYVIQVVRWIAPLMLIVFGMIDFGKASIANDEKALGLATSSLIRRFLASIIIFFIPTIILAILEVTDVTGGIEDKNNTSFGKCTKCLFDPANECEGEGGRILDNVTDGLQDLADKLSHYTRDLIYYNQTDYPGVKFCSTYTLAQAGCGGTSLSIIASSFGDPSYNPKVVASWLCSNGHKNGALPTSFFVSSKTLNKFGLSVLTLWDKTGAYQGNAGKTYNEAEGKQLLNTISTYGKGVILYVPGHYLVVGPNKQCKKNQVFLYDVGNRNNKGCYTPKELFSKTYNYGNRCTSNGNCGWKGAWAYTSK